jgi:CheY-like chemotaxis protein
MWVESDPLLLERILSNLAANAIRYTTRGGGVIGARRRGGRIAIEVWDSGIGIADDERERIFEEFYQVGNVERHSARGMGLGLSIVRRLATLLEHSLRLDSRLGRGSRFVVEVPRAPSSEIDLAPATSSAAPGSAPLAGVQVAVIDDEGIVVDGMRALYSAWGAEVVAGTTGDAVLSAMGEVGRCPDLIVADYRLAGGELGTQVVSRLRHELGAPIPALLISGDSSRDALQAMRESHCEVMLKPVLPGELQELSLRLLAAKKSAPERGA